MKEHSIYGKAISKTHEACSLNPDYEITVESLFKNYASTLYFVIYRIVKSPETAEDLLQDVFVKIWQNLHNYSATQGSLYSWMCTIARNHAISYLRSSHAKNLPRLVDDNSIISISNKLYTSVISTNNIGVRELLKSLPTNQKELIHIFYFNGLTHTEIAEACKMPLGTVKTKLRSAVNNLRKLVLYKEASINSTAEPHS